MATFTSQPFHALSQMCLSLFDLGSPVGPFDLAEQMMDHESVAMHCPDHHFIVSAALLTAARMSQGCEREQLEHDLKTAAERAAKVPGGFCGNCGCCGAAIGCGICAAILLDAAPKKQEHWALCNHITALCLDRIATVEGPRCCKRVTYLALSEIVERTPELLGVDLGAVPTITCHRFANSKECKRKACPFFPVHAEE